jgi:asparagine synthase (glutamine-hydrolysing)
MCGITGLFDTRTRRDFDRSLLQRMNDSQAHRGPDGEGLHLEPGVGLGHRRLRSSTWPPGSNPVQ